MGIYASHTRDNVHCYHVAYGQYEEKQSYLKRYIHSNLMFIYSAEARDRILNHWIDPGFNLNVIKDDVELPDQKYLLKNEIDINSS